MKNRIRAFENAFKGIAQGVREEFHLRIHVTIALLVIATGFIFKITKTEWLIVLLCLAMVVSAELFNAAIEKLADRITAQKDPLIGAAKDIAAGAVLITAMLSLVIGIIIFLPYVCTFLF
jgi:diacylglycerol kinase